MKIKKALSCALSALVLTTSFASFAACGGEAIFGGEDKDNPKVDSTKSQLYVGVFDGGLGREWTEEARTLFEAQYAEQSFEPGKKGVQIMYDYSKTDYLDTLVENMPHNRQEVYLLGQLKYYDFIDRGHLLDITDVVTEGGEDSLESKMNKSLRDYFRIGEGTYYALPLFEAPVHIVYDVDLFDKEHLWFGPDGGFVEVDNASTTPGARRPGMSGGEDGWDAGLPETYSEFFLLLEEMVARGITPFTWSGAQVGTYLQHLTNSFWADYQGAEEFAQNFTMDGSVPVRTITSTDFTEPEVGKFSLPTEVLSTATMTKENAQEVAAMEAGKYFALKLSHDILYGKKYVNQARVNSPAESHLLAQATYLQSTRSSKKIAMLVEGNWWYNEAKTVMDAMKVYGPQYSDMARRFGIMPIPKADDGSSAEGRTLTSSGDSTAVFVSKYIAETKINLAKDFIRFLNTEESMRRFTVATNIMRPYDYTLTEEDVAKLPYYAKNWLEAREDITIEYMSARTTSLRIHNDYLTSIDWTFNSRFNIGYGMNTMDIGVPFSTYFNYPDCTAKQWFQGLDTYRKVKPYDFTK